MKMINNPKKGVRGIKSLIAVTDLKEALILRYTGHKLYSIEKSLDSTTFYFDFWNTTLALINDLPKRSLKVEPMGFLECIDNLNSLLEDTTKK